MNRGLAVLVLCLSVAFAACGGDDDKASTTSGKPKPSTTSETKRAASKATSTAKPARLGRAVTVAGAGNNAGDKVAIRLLSFKDDVAPNGSRAAALVPSAARAGKRFVRLEFRVTNLGKEPVTIKPTDAGAVAADGDSYRGVGGELFPPGLGRAPIEPGKLQTGFAGLLVPEGKKLTVGRLSVIGSTGHWRLK